MQCCFWLVCSSVMCKQSGIQLPSREHYAERITFNLSKNSVSGDSKLINTQLASLAKDPFTYPAWLAILSDVFKAFSSSSCELTARPHDLSDCTFNWYDLNTVGTNYFVGSEQLQLCGFGNQLIETQNTPSKYEYTILQLKLSFTTPKKKAAYP